MTEKQRALILFSIRELQMSIQYDRDGMLANLKDFYGVAISSADELFTTLEDLAKTVNLEGLDNG
jgi:hypothetical protein